MKYNYTISDRRAETSRLVCIVSSGERTWQGVDDSGRAQRHVVFIINPRLKSDLAISIIFTLIFNFNFNHKIRVSKVEDHQLVSREERRSLPNSPPER